MPTVENIWSEYEKMMATPTPEPSYGTLVVQRRGTVASPTYGVSFTPFNTAVTQITAFTDKVAQLPTDAANVGTAVTDLVNYIQTTGKNIPISFNVNDIIDLNGLTINFDIALSVGSLCGLESTLPTNVLGAIQNVGHAVLRGLITNVMNYLDKINQAFACPTRMLNNLNTWMGNTKESVKVPFSNERAAAMKSLRAARRELKLTNDPAVKIQINTYMNTIGSLDNKIRGLITKLEALERAINIFKVDLENCARLGVGLVKNIKSIMAAWQKDFTCIQTRFKSLIES